MFDSTTRPLSADCSAVPNLQVRFGFFVPAYSPDAVPDAIFPYQVRNFESFFNNVIELNSCKIMMLLAFSALACKKKKNSCLTQLLSLLPPPISISQLVSVYT